MAATICSNLPSEGWPATQSLAGTSRVSDEATEAFATAARLIRWSRVADARNRIRGIDEAELRRHFHRVIDESSRRRRSAAYAPPATVPTEMRHPARMPAPSRWPEIFERDGWRCRWCGTKVVQRDALRLMSTMFPYDFPIGKSSDDVHGLALCTAASIDHVVAHAYGGTNGEYNLVTACAPCQIGRSEDLIDRLALQDPRDRPPQTEPEWHGCAWFV